MTHSTMSLTERQIEPRICKIRNPYYQAFQRLSDKSADSFMRDRLIGHYAWSIPDPKIASLIAKYTRRIVEIGAGGGYWAWYLYQYGVDVEAYDTEPCYNPWSQNMWWAVNKGSVEKIQAHPDRTLFLCWPCYGDAMAVDALCEYTGDLFIYSGEGRDGCTADSDFFDLLERDWQLIAERKESNWTPLQSRTQVYRRKAVQ